MRKLDRLRWIEATYGPEYVLPYRACYDWHEVARTIEHFWYTKLTPSLRTDWRDAPEQGYNLPFVHPGVCWPQAWEVWDKWREKLVYIVTEGVSPEQTMCNAAAERLGPSLLLVEWDEGGCAQRAWEQTCVLLHHAFVDDVGGWWQPVQPWPHGVRVKRPKMLPSELHMERMYPLLLAAGDKHAVWTVRRDGQIVIW